MSDLRTWILNQKIADPKFSEGNMARNLGISHHHFSAVKNNNIAFSLTLALKIENATKGAVKAFDMMTENLKKFPRIRNSTKYKERKKRKIS
jgi:DNA-binding transcriptional regulator YdaS (Cro superfamily)